MFATVLDAKRLQLLHEALPAAGRIAVLAVSERRHAMTLAAMAVTALAEVIESLRSTGGSGILPARLHRDARSAAQAW